ncbi:hypothetical protein QZH41_010887, partial [Actinostola sp. cb2023]
PSIEVKDSLSAIDNLTEELSRLDIASDFSPSSSQDTQYNTEESESQVPREDSKAQESNENRKTDALDIFLDESSIGPLGSILRHPWGDTSTKTRLHYTTKASAIIAEVVRTVAPQSAAALWTAVRNTDEVSKLRASDKLGSELLIAVSESYKQASKSETKRQLLSLVASKVSYAELTKHIPELTRYQCTAARRYRIETGAGLRLDAPPKQIREKVDPGKLEHFLDFVTSSNIVQDLPFGRRTLNLTSGAVIDIPNVIRTVLPSRLIVQYNQYCEESSYQPLSRTTLFRILSESCVASVRKSLQGLDNYAAEGGRGFDDLISILDTLLQYGAGDAMTRHLKDQLRQLKQYIKGDYKAYNIGEGHFWSWTGFDGDSFDWITDDVGEGGFIPVKHRQVKETRQPVICSNTELDDDSSDPVLTSDSHLFVCPEDGCVKSYISHGRLEQHLMFGKHEFRLERTRLMDKAKVRYAERLEAGALGCISISNISGRKQGTGTPCTLTQGWAHRETSKRHTRFSAKQKAYLENKFQVGERTGVKANPEDVAKEMRCVRDDTDQRFFRVEEFLRPAQITSYFSRMAAKRKVPVTASDDEAEEYRRHQTAARDNVIHALQETESRHPILYSRTNLCSLEEKQIAAFKMTQLRSIVNHFGVKADGRTKIAFVEAITSFLSKCSCKY